ncbi:MULTISPECIES: class I lanthipeptide [unclassified Flavobacterium]|uniref:class I lanthipeptide n=1 Tax=unclassified Flavobacterium TaxID=196869 RepID=UPI0036194570
MKKQNANNKLAFNKAAVIELNEKNMHEVNGGTSGAFTVGTTSLLTLTVSSDVILKEY